MLFMDWYLHLDGYLNCESVLIPVCHIYGSKYVVFACDNGRITGSISDCHAEVHISYQLLDRYTCDVKHHLYSLSIKNHWSALYSRYGQIQTDILLKWTSDFYPFAKKIKLCCESQRGVLCCDYIYSKTNLKANFCGHSNFAISIFAIQ